MSAQVLKVKRVGKDWRVLSNNLEVAEIWVLPNGHFGLKVHGVFWLEDKSTNTRGGFSHETFNTMIEAYVNAGYLYGIHKNEIKS